MALATSIAVASSRARRLRIALLLAVLFLPVVAAAADSNGAPIYIWRDANGIVRFSTPPQPR